ncbi:TlpA family protein disulfide reductase [Dokdonia sp. Hel_I_53]|uniref:TlpA family protein disulfide reductase n=1 Tax=Dokdonia sp. Hel_I_53 TaxID=1566287 RepID=UPI00119C208B|nr:TlpA disulfide reductase family protein [Dokdonia sp. Hel_I_53]TVZ51895.1 AhpC/TSA family protein [Dokdonia sp. Hel_I_53]
MKSIKVLIISVILFSCQGKAEKNTGSAFKKSGELLTLDFNELQRYIDTHSSKTLVINFWATWCKPCVKELSAFEKIQATYNDKDLSVILVSLDFPEQLDDLKKFIRKRELKSEVVFLNDDKANDWIPRVSDNWSGAIPATLIVSDKKRDFYERSFDYIALEKRIKPHLNTIL